MHIMYFTERPYLYVPEDEVLKIQSFFGVPNRYFDPVKGAQLLNEYLDDKVIAEELGFDGVMLNEHHGTPFCMGAGMGSRRGQRAARQQRQPGLQPRILQRGARPGYRGVDQARSVSLGGQAFSLSFRESVGAPDPKAASADLDPRVSQPRDSAV